MRKKDQDAIFALFGVFMSVIGMALVSSIVEQEAYPIYQTANVGQLAQGSYWYGSTFEGSSRTNIFKRGPELKKVTPSSSPMTSNSKSFIKVTSPNGGEIVKQGQTLDITWDSNRISSKVNIDLLKSTTNSVSKIKDYATDKDSYKWKIPLSTKPGNDYKIRIYDAGNKLVYDDSDRNFSIATSTTVSATTTGVLSVSTDPATPSFSVVLGGSVSNVVGAYNFYASNDSFTLKQLSLKLTQGVPHSIIKATIWEGSTQVGEVIFIGKVATSTLSKNVLISKGTNKILSIKIDTSDIGAWSPLNYSGEIVKVDYLNAVAVGLESGNNVNVTGSTNVSGVKIMKSYPTFSLDSLPSGGINDGRLLRFKITAESKGSVSVGSFYIGLRSGTGGNVAFNDVSVRAYEDSAYSRPILGFSAGELVSGISGAGMDGNFLVARYENNRKAPLFVIPAGQTVYIEVNGKVSSPWYRPLSLVTYLVPENDTSGLLYKGAPLSTGGNSIATGNFIWSPNSTTTPLSSHNDWFNGAVIPGLQSIYQVRTK